MHLPSNPGRFTGGASGRVRLLPKATLSQATLSQAKRQGFDPRSLAPLLDMELPLPTVTPNRM